MWILKPLWIITGSILAVIGLAGLPEDFATWATWLEQAQPMLNDPSFQWLALLGAFLLFFGGIAYGGATLSIPFRRKFRYWLNTIEDQDNANLAKCLPLHISQIVLRSGKEGRFLRLNLRIFNGSVYSLKCVGIAGEAPFLKDTSPDERTILPRLQIQGKCFHDLHHAENGDLMLNILLPDDLVEKIQSAKYRNEENRSNALFDFRNTVLVILAKETGQKHVVSLPAIHMSDARQIGLGQI